MKLIKKKKNKNKAFTLVELLITIALIGLIIGIGVPGVMKISQKMKQRSLNTKINLIEQAAILWGQDNKTRLSSHECDIDGDGIKETQCYQVILADLITDDYLNSEKKIENGEIYYENPVTGDNISAKCIFVYKKNNRIYSKFLPDNACNIQPPKFVEKNVSKKGEIHTKDFKLEIQNPNPKSLNYKIKYEIIGENIEESTNQKIAINIDKSVKISAEICDNNSNCSDTIEYEAILIKDPIFKKDTTEITESTYYSSPFNLKIVDTNGETDYTLKYAVVSPGTTPSYSEVTGNINIGTKQTISAKICNNDNKCGNEVSKNFVIYQLPEYYVGSDKVTGTIEYYEDKTITIKNPNSITDTEMYYKKTSDADWTKITSEYTPNITINTSTTYQAKVCNKVDTDKCTDISEFTANIKKLGDVIITASDGIPSGQWHKSAFTLNIKAENAAYLYEESYIMPKINVNQTELYFNSNTGNSGNTLNVEAGLNNAYKRGIYVVKLDKVAPTISITQTENYFDQSQYTLSFKDIHSYLSGYGTSTNSTCSNVTWIPISGKEVKKIPVSINTSGTHYICAKDNAGNIASQLLTGSDRLYLDVNNFQYEIECDSSSQSNFSGLSCYTEKRARHVYLILKSKIKFSDNSFVEVVNHCDSPGSKNGYCVFDFPNNVNFNEFSNKEYKYEYKLKTNKEHGSGYTSYVITLNLCDMQNKCTGEIKITSTSNAFMQDQTYTPFN